MLLKVGNGGFWDLASFIDDIQICHMLLLAIDKVDDQYVPETITVNFFLRC